MFHKDPSIKAVQRNVALTGFKAEFDGSKSQLDQLKTAVQRTYRRLLNLPSHREHKNLVLEKEVKRQLQSSQCNVLGAENAQNLINTDRKVEKLAIFHRKLLEELVRRCFRDATNNKELFFVDFGRSEISSAENIENVKEVSISTHRINDKIVTHPIVGGSAKAYATAIKKMKIHSSQQGLKGIATVETSPTQPIRPKSNNIASMVLPVVNSYFLLRNQIIRLQNMLRKNVLKLTQQTKSARNWKMMLNYYEMYSPRLIRSASARLLVKLQVLGSLFCIPKQMKNMRNLKRVITMICIFQGIWN